MEEITPQKKSWIRQHYHWVIFATVFLDYMLYASVVNNCSSLFLIPVTKDLGISRSAFSLCSTLACVPGFCANLLLFPRFYKRVGYRKSVAVLLAFYAVIMLCYSRAQGIGVFYVCATLFALVTPFVSTAGISRVITDWFHKHRGLLLGIVLAASGVGSSIGSMVLSAVMDAYGWRIAYVVCAGIVLVGAALVFLLVRNTPEEMGLQPFGAEEISQDAVVHTHEDHARAWEGIPLSILKKRFHFYMMLAVVLLSNISAYVIYPTIVSHVQDVGMSLSAAAQIQSLMFLFLAAAKVFEGVLSDRFGARWVMAFCIICCVASSVMLAAASTYGMTVLGVAVFSIALAESSVMLPVLVEDVYGAYDRSAILGVILAVCQLATGFGPTLGNIAYDRMGSYAPIYYMVGALAAVSLVIFFAALRGAVKERQNVLLEEERILNP